MRVTPASVPHRSGGFRRPTGGSRGWGAASRRGQLIDPSSFTWRALPAALAGGIVPVFPVADTSVSQSHAGSDLELHRAAPALVGETAA